MRSPLYDRIPSQEFVVRCRRDLFRTSALRQKRPFAELRTRTLLSGGPHLRRSGARCTARPRLTMLYAIAAEPTLSATSLLIGDLDGRWFFIWYDTADSE